MKIGLALSGGGIRALIFHLGVLYRLADENLIKNINHISTVSGGSLCVGLIFRFNNYKWPTSIEYKEKVFPKIKNLLTTVNLENHLMFYSFFTNRILRTKGIILEYCLKKKWKIDYKIKDLPDKPIWWINSTCFETGVNWRFSQEYIGDYIFGKYYEDTDISISKALAASAAFPFLIGPIKLKPNWGKQKIIHLWDGGVYDNLGIEALYKPSEGLISGINTLFISDGGVKMVWQNRTSFKSIRRLLDVPISQVRALRSRMIISNFINKSVNGAYFQIGNNTETILKRAGISNYKKYSKNTLSEDIVRFTADFPTRLYSVSTGDFDLIVKHGYEVVNATLHGYMNRKYITKYPKSGYPLDAL